MIIIISIVSFLALGLSQAQMGFYDPYSAQLNQMMQATWQQMQKFEMQKQQYISQYVAQKGYGPLYKDYLNYGSDFQRLTGFAFTYSFEDYLYYRMLAEAGVDLTALNRQQVTSFNQTQAAMQDLSNAYDAYNQSWYDNQASLDQTYADYSSAAIRGEWAFGNPDTGNYTLPIYPDANTYYPDPSGGIFYYDATGWNQVDTSGYITPLETLPHSDGY
ncbi:MAG: hypothetical protein KC422_24190 [Trueperaceae bacterium]|nr:hypothetical protein [Trueperaceae bacterium]